MTTTFSCHAALQNGAFTCRITDLVCLFSWPETLEPNSTLALLICTSALDCRIFILYGTHRNHSSGLALHIRFIIVLQNPLTFLPTVPPDAPYPQMPTTQNGHIYAVAPLVQLLVQQAASQAHCR